MRIISSFRDYYDNATWGHFDEPEYLRETVSDIVDGPYVEDVRKYREIGVGIHCTPGIIKFTGVIHPFVHVTHYPDSRYMSPRADRYCYSKDEVGRFLEEVLTKRDLNILASPKWYKCSRKDLIDHLSVSFIGKPSLSKWSKPFDWEGMVRRFVESPMFIPKRGVIQNAPVYAVEKVDRYGYTVISNPVLKNFEFFRVKDAPTAWQDLRMYLSNLAHPEPVIPKIDDTDMAKSKGYDKWSFKRFTKNSKE